MQCNAAAIAIAKRYEKCSLIACPAPEADHWQIGWGLTEPWVKEGMTCTQQQADNWLYQKFSNISATLSRIITVPVTNNQFSALCELAYNIGLGAIISSSAIALLNQKRFDMVPSHIAMWNKMHVKDEKGNIVEVVSSNLQRRRADEIILFNTPDS